ncbi:hypothetical protein L2E82_39404 [Cichorium intybus]|uniref:Uncharacterized protein n=1 Tax=Cichorium intybus TaxID=13427 RepID=A0ACB9AJV1_CICIN|nr:hypothetical protein L2E82_39404 [Cichorium intybus]
MKELQAMEDSSSIHPRNLLRERETEGSGLEAVSRVCGREERQTEGSGLEAVSRVCGREVSTGADQFPMDCGPCLW